MSVSKTIDINDVLHFIRERLRAGEGGAPSVRIVYDDATSDYLIVQRDGFGNNKQDLTLGCSRSLARAFELAVSGEVYDKGEEQE